MSRGPLRTVFAGLALALALALAAPARGEAAGPRGEDPGPAPRWIASLLEEMWGMLGDIGLHIDPNGDIGLHIDPDGASVPPGGTATPAGDGDIGWHLDPDG